MYCANIPNTISIFSFVSLEYGTNISFESIFNVFLINFKKQRNQNKMINESSLRAKIRSLIKEEMYKKIGLLQINQKPKLNIKGLSLKLSKIFLTSFSMAFLSPKANKKLSKLP